MRILWSITYLVMTLWPLPAIPQPANPALGGCPIFPADNIWNTRVDTLPVHARSAEYIASIGSSTGLKADFGSGLWNGGPIGIPFMLVSGTTPKSAVDFEYDDESDPGPYPIPANPLIEGGSQSNGDRHILLVDIRDCVLYELYYAYPPESPGAHWTAGSGAIYNLRSNNLRPAGWTSADAAGLPILPGLVRYDEVAAGEIAHAVRFTVSISQRAYVWPARHYASSNTSLSRPPMGARFRLKSSVDISAYPAQVRVILTALKKYGMIVADNGSNWYISGAPDERWNNEVLRAIAGIKGSDFEAVDVSSLMVTANSGRVPWAAPTHWVYMPLVNLR